MGWPDRHMARASGPETRLDDLHFTAREMKIDQIETGALSLAGSWHGWIDNPKARFSVNVRDIASDRLKIELLDLTGDLQGTQGP